MKGILVVYSEPQLLLEITSETVGVGSLEYRPLCARCLRYRVGCAVYHYILRRAHVLVKVSGAGIAVITGSDVHLRTFPWRINPLELSKLVWTHRDQAVLVRGVHVLLRLVELTSVLQGFEALEEM